MDRVLCLVLNDEFFDGPYGFSSRFYRHQNSGTSVDKDELEAAERAADKLELWLNNLSL